MDILVLGGTRYFGVRLVRKLLEDGHRVVVATRGLTPDPFGERVERVRVDRYRAEQLHATFGERTFDVVYDNLAYASNDVEILLSAVRCKRYIMTSSSSVYPLRLHTAESAFVARDWPLKMGERKDFSYDEGKRQAECAATLRFPRQKATMVRFPIVLGEDDYTRRLYFYVNHIAKGLPLEIDNAAASFSFISSGDAGDFLAALCERELDGPVNAASPETVTLEEILAYIEAGAGCKANIVSGGEAAPFNGIDSHSLSVERAQATGFMFTPLREWLFPLLDFYISQAR